MDWFCEDGIPSKLKDVPKFKMSAWTVRQIKSNLSNFPAIPHTSHKA